MRIIKGIVMAAVATIATSAHAQQASEPFDYGPVHPVSSPAGPASSPSMDQGADGSDLPVTAYREYQNVQRRDARDGQIANSVGVRAGAVATIGNGPSSSWGMVAGRTGNNAHVEQTPEESTDVTAPALDSPVIDVADAQQSFKVPRDPSSGHYIATVRLNGVRTRVIIDTGATNTILSPEAAKNTGAIRDITHSQYAAGIGGVATLNATRIRSFMIGGREIGGFDALIGQGAIPYTLLGQTELRRLGRIVIDNDVLTITPRDTRVAAR